MYYPYCCKIIQTPLFLEFTRRKLIGQGSLNYEQKIISEFFHPGPSSSHTTDQQFIYIKLQKMFLCSIAVVEYRAI